MTLSRAQATDSLRSFKNRRDALLHEDVEVFNHNLRRFIDHCTSDELAGSVLKAALQSYQPDVITWWQNSQAANDRRDPTLVFPSKPDEELALLYAILRQAASQDNWIREFGSAFGKYKTVEAIELFRLLIVRPFADELTHRLGEAANLASPEERALQAVPLARIPKEKEIRIFLSHKTVDKPLVYRYHNALATLGYAPWLDEPELAAGANLEREVLRGFQESCAAVFFITENFKDEKYLAAEIDYAVIQKREKGPRFAIITLRYSNAAPVPGLLKPYIYKTVENDLEGFNELLRALPIELGPVRWKVGIVEG